MKPPAYALTAMDKLASCSPCAKSKRGAIVYDAKTQRIWGSGFNAPPIGMFCDGSPECRRDCGKICIHAEQMAIQAALTHVSIDRGREADRDGETALRGMSMLHVKVVDGEIVPGGPPSCWQCSREVMNHDIAEFWLFELGRHHPTGQDPPAWRRYTGMEFHLATLKNCGLYVADLPAATHALWGGRALCNADYLRAVPAEWPAGQTWIGLGDLKGNQLAMDSVTCRVCRNAARGHLAGLQLIGVK